MEQDKDDFFKYIESIETKEDKHRVSMMQEFKPFDGRLESFHKLEVIEGGSIDHIDPIHTMYLSGSGGNSEADSCERLRLYFMYFQNPKLLNRFWVWYEEDMKYLDRKVLMAFGYVFSSLDDYVEKHINDYVPKKHSECVSRNGSKLLLSLTNDILSTAIKPDFEASFVVASHVMKVLAGAAIGINEKQGISGNMTPYTMIIGETGGGKDALLTYAKKAIAKILGDTAVAEMLPASIQGLYDGLIQSAEKCEGRHIKSFVIDEAQCLIKAQNEFSSGVLTMLTASYGGKNVSKPAKQNDQKTGKVNQPGIIENTHLTVLGATQPDIFRRTLAGNEDIVDNGSLGRYDCVYVRRGDKFTEPDKYHPCPDVIESLRKWFRDLVAHSVEFDFNKIEMFNKLGIEDTRYLNSLSGSSKMGKLYARNGQKAIMQSIVVAAPERVISENDFVSAYHFERISAGVMIDTIYKLGQGKDMSEVNSLYDNVIMPAIRKASRGGKYSIRKSAIKTGFRKVTSVNDNDFNRFFNSAIEFLVAPDNFKTYGLVERIDENRNYTIVLDCPDRIKAISSDTRKTKIQRERQRTGLRQKAKEFKKPS